MVDLEKLLGKIEKIDSKLANQVKEIIQESERIKIITENIPGVGIYRNTPGEQGKFIEINNEMCKLFGYESKEEFKQVSVSDLYWDYKNRKRISDKLVDM